MVAYHMTALHRRKDLWGDDAESFNPGRWDKETDTGSWVQLTRTSKGIANYSQKYLPFNAGPRVCIGRRFYKTSPPKALSMLTFAERTVCYERGIVCPHSDGTDLRDY